MAWHIFRKDWHLLWPFAVALAVGEALVVTLYSLFEFQEGRIDLAVAVEFLAFFIFVGAGVLIVLAVQHEATPSLRQDWLIRPIRRGDLFLSKLVFVLLVIHGPLIVIGCLHGLAEGFGFGSALGAALVRNTYMMLVFSLPLLTVATLTGSVTEVLVGSFAVSIAIVLLVSLLAITGGMILHTRQWDFRTIGTDVAWVWQSVSFVVLLVGMAAAVTLQYSRRATVLSRALFIAALLLGLLVRALPWDPAFALQSWLSKNPGASRSFTVVFDPSVGPVAGGHDFQSSRSDLASPAHEDVMMILLPMRFSGLPSDLILHGDRTAVRLVDATGKAVYRGIESAFDSPAAATGDGQRVFRQTIHIPSDRYQVIKDETLRLEIDYSLTLLQVRAQPPMPAVSADRRIPDVGRCVTWLDDAGAAVEVSCVAVGEMPSFFSIALQQPHSQQPSLMNFSYPLDYAPFRSHLSLDALSYYNARLQVDQRQVRDAQIVLRVYEPIDHFSRSVTAPGVRLRDWQLAPVPRVSSAR
jgi:hypothetical protein